MPSVLKSNISKSTFTDELGEQHKGSFQLQKIPELGNVGLHHSTSL